MHPFLAQNWSGRRVLLLQGPVGFFFARLERWLRNQGAQTHRIAFTGGDWIFAPWAEVFRGDLRAWRTFVRTWLDGGLYDDIILFGDCRPVHRVVRRLAKNTPVRVWCFEEGYLRPNWITCELGGNNGFSPLMEGWPEMPSDAESEFPRPVVSNPRWAFHAMAIQAMAYWVASYVALAWVPFLHHRRLDAPREAICWLRSGWRKLVYGWKERRALRQLSELVVPYAVLILQVHNDFQLRKHGRIKDPRQLIEETVRSFAHYAPSNMVLVIKHHPMDRAYRDYTDFAESLAKQYNLTDRLIVLHDVHLPTLLKMSRGCITVNSTVGLQAIQHGIPVHAIGRTFYDRPGLTHQDALDSFWTWCLDQRPDPGVFNALRKHLVNNVLLNDNFYISLGLFTRTERGEMLLSRKPLAPLLR